MVMALLGILLLVLISGLFSNDDMMSKGVLAHHVSDHLSDLATAWHENSFYFLLVLVAIHLAAIAFYLLVKKDNLVRPMITGIKQFPHNSDISTHHIRSVWLALLILFITSGAVWLLVKFA